MLESVRNACAKVCAAATHVRIHTNRIEDYAATLPVLRPTIPDAEERDQFFGSTEETVAFIVTLDSINFGSGYFPHLQKRDNLSGYFTIASFLKDYFRGHGPLKRETLLKLNESDCAKIFGQDLDDPVRQELMALFARALNDLGVFLQSFNGTFIRIVEAAGGSANRLAELLCRMPLFRDFATYDGFDVPFYKRAQITAADLAIRFGFEGPGKFTDLEQLTIFADNVVPNVLRVDGIVEYDSDLARRIDAGELILPGSKEEIEVRAGAVHSAELLVAVMRQREPTMTAMAMDYLLWNRGRGAKYKASPRHRTRTAFY